MPSPPSASVLLVSDLAVLRNELSHWLASPLVQVQPAPTADNLQIRASEMDWDLVVWDLDAGSLGLEGVDAVMRQRFGDTPRVVLWPGDSQPPRNSAERIVRFLPSGQLTRESFLEAVGQVAPTVRELLPA